MTKDKKVTLPVALAILAALGYGGYTLVKNEELADLKSGTTSAYKVARVIDGDTFELEDGDVVRMLGIDAPEEGECYYDGARAALTRKILKQEVELREDVTKTDDFGRLLRYTILPGQTENVLVDEYMVFQGFAVPAKNAKDKLYYATLLAARESAMKAKRGLWGKCETDVISEHGQKDTKAPNALCTVKGNIAVQKTYFVEGCNNYAQVKIDPARGEKYFCSESAATEAGFEKARYCP